MLSTFIKKVCSIVRDVSEYYNISLGRLSPYVFGGMIGRMPRKIKEEEK